MLQNALFLLQAQAAAKRLLAGLEQCLIIFETRKQMPINIHRNPDRGVTEDGLQPFLGKPLLDGP